MIFRDYRDRLLVLAKVSEEQLQDSGLARRFEEIAASVLPEEYLLPVDELQILRELCAFEIQVGVEMIRLAERRLALVRKELDALPPAPSAQRILVQMSDELLTAGVPH